MAWNRSSEKKVEVEVRGRQGNGRLKGLVAGVIVVLGAAMAAWWLLSDLTPPPSTSTSTSTSLIREVTPAKAATNTVAKKPKFPGAPLDWNKPYPPEAYWKDGSLKQHTRWVCSHTNKCINKLYISPEAKVFPERGINLELAEILTAEPGEQRIGTYVYDEKYEKRFLRSLKRPIIIKDDDSEYAKELKRAVLETKKDIMDRHAKGESIAQIMTDNDNQMRELSLYRKEIEDQVRAIRKDKRGEFSSEEMRELYSAANAMLEDRGVKPLAMPEMLIRKIKIKEAQMSNGKEQGEVK